MALIVVVWRKIYYHLASEARVSFKHSRNFDGRRRRGKIKKWKFFFVPNA
jgi:hypothetical protein